MYILLLLAEYIAAQTPGKNVWVTELCAYYEAFYGLSILPVS